MSQVQLDVPALAIEQLQSFFGRFLGAQQGRDQGLSAGTQLTHDHRRGRTVILRRSHPFGFDLGLGQSEQVVARAHDQAILEIRCSCARAVLLEDRIDAPFVQVCQQEIGGVERIAQQHLATLQRVEHRPQQRLLVAAFAVVAAARRIQDGAAAQTDQGRHAAQRKTHARFLATRLGIARLIGRRIGHRDGRAVDQARRPTSPLPRGWHAIGQVSPAMAGKRRDQWHRQALPRAAIGASVCVLHRGR